jgi:hypothetical protein
MIRHCLLAVALAAAALAATAAPALACSCAYFEPEEHLAAADAAFIGKVVKKTLIASRPRRGDDVYRYRVRVRRSFKRTLTRRIRITANTNSGMCGFEWDRGDRVAAYLHKKHGPYRIGLCSLESPRSLREAAKGAASAVNPRPRPRSPRSTCR